MVEISAMGTAETAVPSTVAAAPRWERRLNDFSPHAVREPRDRYAEEETTPTTKHHRNTRSKVLGYLGAWYTAAQIDWTCVRREGGRNTNRAGSS